MYFGNKDLNDKKGKDCKCESRNLLNIYRTLDTVENKKNMKAYVHFFPFRPISLKKYDPFLAMPTQ